VVPRSKTWKNICIVERVTSNNCKLDYYPPLHKLKEVKLMEGFCGLRSRKC